MASSKLSNVIYAGEYESAMDTARSRDSACATPIWPPATNAKVGPSQRARRGSMG
jgi:hypothetical protein